MCTTKHCLPLWNTTGLGEPLVMLWKVNLYKIIIVQVFMWQCENVFYQQFCILQMKAFADFIQVNMQ